MRKTEEEELKFNVVEITFDNDESFEAKLNEQYTGIEEPVASFVLENKYYYFVFKVKDDGKEFKYIRPSKWQSEEVYGKFQLFFEKVFLPIYVTEIGLKNGAS